MRNIKLILEYDGTDYVGWQIQPDWVGKSVQGELTKALRIILQHEIQLNGAGRTDAGVHALGQVANFQTANPIPLSDIARAVNTVLPQNIVIKSAQEVEADFHARFSAQGKTYRYVVNTSPAENIFSCRYSWHQNRPLNVAAMAEAAAYLRGEHDFTSFCGTNSKIENHVRTITACSVKDLKQVTDILNFPALEQGLLIEISANGFLYKMVRFIVGQLVAVGIGKIPPQEMLVFLNGTKAQYPVAPAQGLFMTEVQY